MFSFFKDDFRSCNRTVEFHVPRKKCDNRLAFDVEGGGLAEFYDSRPSVLFGGVNIYFPFNVDNNFGMYDPYSADVQAFKLSMFAKRLSGEDFDERWEVDATVSLRFDCRMENFELPGACGWGGIGRGGGVSDGVSVSGEIGLTPYLYSDEDAYKRRRWYVVVDSLFGRKYFKLNKQNFISALNLRLGHVHNFDYTHDDRNFRPQADDRASSAEFSISLFARDWSRQRNCMPALDLRLGHTMQHGGPSDGSNSYLGISIYMSCGEPAGLHGGSNRLRRRGIVFP